MRRLRNILNPHCNGRANVGRPQPDANRSTPDHGASQQPASDREPSLVSRIAVSFWCQPGRAPSASRQQPNCIASTRDVTAVVGRSDNILTLAALALALVAAILSTPDHADRMHRMAQWLMWGTAPEAAINAGAVGESRDTFQVPDFGARTY